MFSGSDNFFSCNLIFLSEDMQVIEDGSFLVRILGQGKW